VRAGIRSHCSFGRNTETLPPKKRRFSPLEWPQATKGNDVLPEFNSLDAETLKLIEAKLPYVAVEIIGLIGREAGFALFSAMGGLKYKFSRGVTERGRIRFEKLVAVIGRQNVLRLINEYGSESIYIPRCLVVMNMLRNRKIVAEYDELTKWATAMEATSELSRRYFMSYRSIENIVNNHDGV
jgi:hypothetical protein